MKHRVPHGYWKIKKNVINDAKKYNRLIDWKRNSAGAYNTALKNRWIDECRKHTKSKFKVKAGFWQIQKNVIYDARKYSTRTEWQKISRGAYKSALRYGWLDICCKHMTVKIGKWLIKKNVISDSGKYKTRTEWSKKSGSAYDAARRNGWMDECNIPDKRFRNYS